MFEHTENNELVGRGIEPATLVTGWQRFCTVLYCTVEAGAGMLPSSLDNYLLKCQLYETGLSVPAYSILYIGLCKLYN